MESPIAAEQHLSPPVAVGAQSRRRWSPILVGLLVLAGAFFWLRPHGRDESPVAIAQCHALMTEARLALAAGDAVAAESGIDRVRSVCGVEQSGAVEVLETQLGHLKAQVAACVALEKNLLKALSSGHPRDVSGRVVKAPRGCASQPAITRLVERGARQIELATTAVNDGFGRLNAGDLDGADAMLARALRSDAQVSGAEGLRSSLAKARLALAVSHSTPAVTSVVVTQPPVTRTPRAPVQAPVRVDSVFDDLVGDGRRALQRKNYAEAKSAAKSALRLSPGNRSAQALLREAEDGEREALQGMNIR
ncbi:hypothetical protein [Rhodanobacter fulvus]|nr:hypothetical protein [Rhodanobacter fulvus]